MEDILADEGVSLDLELTDLETDADEDGDLLKLTIDNAAVQGTAFDNDGESDGRRPGDRRPLRAGHR